MNRPLFPYPNSRDVEGAVPYRFASPLDRGATIGRPSFIIVFRGGSKPPPYRFAPFLNRNSRGVRRSPPTDLRRFSTVGEGSPLPRFNKSKTVCIVILEQSEGSADGFLHFLLSIISYLFSII